MKLGLGLTTSVFMPVNVDGANIGGATINSDLYIGLIFAEVKFENCTIEIVVNDIPIKRFTSNQNSFQSELVASSLIAGKNNLEIVINPGPTPKHSRDKFVGEVKDDIFVATRLVQYNDSEWLDGKGGKTLSNTLWRSNEHKSVTYPYILTITTELPKSIPTWAWQKSEIVDLTRDNRAIMKILAEFHDGYQNLDGDKIFNLTKHLLKEGNKIHSKGDVPSEKDQNATLVMNMKRLKQNEKGKEWKLKPLDPKDFSLRICANGHLVECIAKDWLPIIRSNTPLLDGDYFYFKIFVGLVNGKGTVLHF